LNPFPYRTRRAISRGCRLDPPNHSNGPPGRAGWGSIHIFPNETWFPSYVTGEPRQAFAQISSCSSRISPRRSNGTPSAAYSSRCQLTVGWTMSRPPLSRSRVARSFAVVSGWRSGLISAPATNRSREVAAATALSSTSGLGHGDAGSWLPGSA
jgi:hypothetical protein